MDSSNENQKKPDVKFSQEQYDMLKRCSEEKDMTEWNEWRVGDGFEEEIMLEGAELMQAHLKGADLNWSQLKGALLVKANLEKARLCSTHLEKASLTGAYLNDADLSISHLEGAYLNVVHLEGANFSRAIVDGNTLIWNCEVDDKTDFRGVGLDSARIDASTRQKLEYSNRRLNWEDWYPKQKPCLSQPVKLFWWFSDYGTSTKRIIGSFFGLALIFAVIYFGMCMVDYFCFSNTANPGCIDKLGASLNVSEPWLSWVWVFFRSIYFSVVTMTTLGFGDMHANTETGRGFEIAGYCLLTLQVLLGYVLLGALVTRLNILFTAGGPRIDEKAGEGVG
ncbi:MAG: pentapeptide repeat-containing protein [Sedimentisphaerales bacterium]|nr:pentapeptide repeat-containing protein [Sedimentisphaerales bacterium]